MITPTSSGILRKIVFLIEFSPRCPHSILVIVYTYSALLHYSWKEKCKVCSRKAKMSVLSSICTKCLYMQSYIMQS